MIWLTRMRREEVRTGFWWGKTEGKRQLGRPRRRWEDNIKMDLQECIDLAQDRDRWLAFVNYVMNLGFQ